MSNNIKVKQTQNSSEVSNVDAGRSIRESAPTVLSIPEAATILTISSRKLRDEIARGKLKVKRIGRRVLIARAELEKFAGMKLS